MIQCYCWNLFFFSNEFGCDGVTHLHFLGDGGVVGVGQLDVAGRRIWVVPLPEFTAKNQHQINQQHSTPFSILIQLTFIQLQAIGGFFLLLFRLTKCAIPPVIDDGQVPLKVKLAQVLPAHLVTRSVSIVMAARWLCQTRTGHPQWNTPAPALGATFEPNAFVGAFAQLQLFVGVHISFVFCSSLHWLTPRGFYKRSETGLVPVLVLVLVLVRPVHLANEATGSTE